MVRYAVAACLLVLLGLYLKPWRWLGGKDEVARKDRQPLPGMLAQELLARIDRLAIADGPFAGGFRLQENDGRLNWYFCNLGLMTECKAQPAAVATYLNLYLKHVDPATGTIADVKDIATGTLQPPDSDDSYAATFLSLASRQRPGNQRPNGMVARHFRPNSRNIARKVLLDAQQPSGLVRGISPTRSRQGSVLPDG